MKIITRVIVSVISGLLYYCAFPPIGLEWLIFVAFIPLFLVLRGIGFKQGFWYGLLFGLAFWSGAVQWLVPLVNHWSDSTWIGWAPYGLLVVFMSLWFGVFGAFSSVAVNASNIPCFFSLPALWVLIEYLRSYVPFNGFPWLLTGTALYEHPYLLMSAGLGGVWLVSSLIVTINALLAFHRRLNWISYAVVFIAVGFIGFFTVYEKFSLDAERLDSDTPSYMVGLFQIGIDLGLQTPNSWRSDMHEALMKASASAPKNLSALIFPESSAPVDIHQNPQWCSNLANAFGAGSILIGAHKLIGLTDYQNTAAVINREGKISDEYAKVRLVPFGEYVPFRKFIPYPSDFNLLSLDCSPGVKVNLLKLEELSVGTPICFESLYPDISRKFARQGADFIAVLVNDDWYENSGRRQHAIACVVRAVENGMPVVRVTPTGYSMLIEGDGSFKELPAGVEAFDLITIKKKPEKTLYTLFGDWVVVFSGIIVLLTLILSRKPEQKDEKDEYEHNNDAEVEGNGSDDGAENN